MTAAPADSAMSGGDADDGGDGDDDVDADDEGKRACPATWAEWERGVTRTCEKS